MYFSTKTENGELALDLLNNSDFACVDKGKGIFEELEKTQKQLDLKVQHIKIKKLKVDLKKSDIDKFFDNLFTITLQLSNANSASKNQMNSLTESTIL